MKKGSILFVLFIANAAGASLLLTHEAPESSTQRASAVVKVPAMWEYTAPLISPEKREQDQSVAQKDPSLVFFEGKWHVFMTIKLQDRTAMEYCSFDRWENADAAPRTILRLAESKYYCAPQVFYFTFRRRSGIWSIRWVCRA